MVECKEGGDVGGRNTEKQRKEKDAEKKNGKDAEKKNETDAEMKNETDAEKKTEAEKEKSVEKKFDAGCTHLLFVVGYEREGFVWWWRRLGRLVPMDEMGEAGRRTKPEEEDDYLAGFVDSLGRPDGMAQRFRGRNREKYGLSERTSKSRRGQVTSKSRRRRTSKSRRGREFARCQRGRRNSRMEGRRRRYRREEGRGQRNRIEGCG